MIGPGRESRLNFDQAHRSSDTDSERDSLHHTLGKRPTQAAPGNHVHPSSDITSGRLDATIAPITDWNAALENGWYAGFGAANAPVGAAWFMGWVESYDAATYITQTVHNFAATPGGADTMMYRRHMQAGVWGLWYRVRIGEAEILNLPPHAEINYTGAAQVIATSTVTKVAFDGTVEATNLTVDLTNDRITVPAGWGGIYLIDLNVTFANNAVGYREARLLKNGAVIIVNSKVNPNLQSYVKAIRVERLAAGDYIEGNVFQNSGGNLNTVPGADLTFMTMTYLRA